MERIESTALLDVIENGIIPISALDWLGVSKKLHIIAKKCIVNDPTILALAHVILAQTTSKQDHRLMKILLSDERYTAQNSLAKAVGAAFIDKTANAILLSYPQLPQSDVQRIFDRAIRQQWLDMITEIISSNRIDNINISRHIYNNISQNILQLFIADPKMGRITSAELYVVSRNDDRRIWKTILQAKNIDLEAAITYLGSDEKFLATLLTDPRLFTPENRALVWNALSYCRSMHIEKSKEIIKQYELDPSLDNNFQLRSAIESDFCPYNIEIIKLYLDDERVLVSLEPILMNPLLIAFKRYQKKLVRELLQHPKIKSEWIEPILKSLMALDGGSSGVSLIVTNYSQYVSNELLESARNHECTPVYDENCFWSDDDDE